MSRIDTKRPRRPFPTLLAGGADPFDGESAEPGSPRAVARRMALEGAALLARHAISVGSPSIGDLADDDFCPLSRRRAAWKLRAPIRAAIAVFASLVFARPSAAQIASASPAALGMGDNFTAAAHGLDAVAWNPAALGLRRVRDPRASFAALVFRGSSGLGPVTLGNLADWSDATVPVSVKQDWLTRIVADRGQVGSGGADVTWAALRVGPVALHASSSARLMADLSPGLAELILFGNVGGSGEARALDVSGSTLTGWAWSALGASWALPFATDGGVTSIGITVKYVMGHAMALGENSTGATTVDPLAVDLRFPIVHTDFGNDYAFDAGHGLAIDLGASSVRGDWTISGVVQNLSNSFAWNPSKLRYRPLSVSLDANRSITETADMPIEDAPAAVMRRVNALRFEPVWAAGIAWRYAPDLLFTADLRFSNQDAILAGPARHLGAGFEYRLTDWLPLRFGGAAISMGPDAEGWQAGAGLGIDLGSWNMAASALRRSAGRLGNSTTLMLGFFGAGGGSW